MMPLRRLAYLVACLAALLAAPPAGANPSLLLDGQDRREIAFQLVAGRPLVVASVDGVPGRMMVDNGTPDAVFLNRDAVALAPGTATRTGKAASGQPVAVQVHPAPSVEIAGQPLGFAAGAEVRSGAFGFTAPGLGADFLGFIGTPMVSGGAFVLDYDRRVMTVLRTDGGGALPLPSPPRAEVLAEIAFAIWPGAQPTTAAMLGDMPILMDIDTGDMGTIYLRPPTQTALERAGQLRRAGEGWVLDGLRFGGTPFGEIPVQLVVAGGPDDHRSTGSSDWLRLGSAFLADHPTLWNFPAGTITVLRRGSGWLSP